jgi:hypothetical protein
VKFEKEKQARNGQEEIVRWQGAQRKRERESGITGEKLREAACADMLPARGTG